jgi:hypothetical protein
MRIIIKNADFSSVSIGKVVKDLSFNYSNGVAVNGILLNPCTNELLITSSGYDFGSGSNVAATYKVASEGDSDWSSDTTTVNRGVSNFIEVSAGMIIRGNHLTGGGSRVPTVVCYNSNKEVLPPSYALWGNLDLFTIPNGVSYIKIQINNIRSTSKIGGTMPE